MIKNGFTFESKVSNVVVSKHVMWYMVPALDVWSCSWTEEDARSFQGEYMRHPIQFGCGSWCFLCSNRISILQEHGITVVALQLGVFQSIVNFPGEALWLKSVEEANNKRYH
jgi:hypothetical protein